MFGFEWCACGARSWWRTGSGCSLYAGGCPTRPTSAGLGSSTRSRRRGAAGGRPRGARVAPAATSLHKPTPAAGKRSRYHDRGRAAGPAAQADGRRAAEAGPQPDYILCLNSVPLSTPGSGRCCSSRSTHSRGSRRAAIAAMAVSVLVVALYRAARRGAFDARISAASPAPGWRGFIALRTGSASGFRVPRAFQNAGLAIRLLGLDRGPAPPLVEWIAAPIYHIPSRLVPRPAVRSAGPSRRGTAASSIVFSVRTVVYTVLILLESEKGTRGSGRGPRLGRRPWRRRGLLLHRAHPAPAQAVRDRSRRSCEESASTDLP